ncbi:MAG: hypothetical protein KC656_01770 [Myxococcales bacterium]|nr:hypothetical protein [Myxococcales bacterium]
MLSSVALALLALVGTARAECRPVEPDIRRAEEDAVAYFVADAEASLEFAATGMACSTIDRATLVRFWLAKAMVWQLAGDDRATRALAAAKALDDTQFTDALGEELRKAWAATDPASLAPALELRIRGLKRGDQVLVDTEPVDPPTLPPGLHLVQVVRDGTVVMGRVVTAEEDSRLSIAIESTGTASTSVVAEGPALDYTLPLPLELRGASVRDAEGRRLDFHTEVLPASLILEPGRDAWSARRTNTRHQGLAVGLGVLAGYASYLAGYKMISDSGASAGWTAGALGAGALTATGATWELLLARKRRMLKATTVETANAVLGDGG